MRAAKHHSTPLSGGGGVSSNAIFKEPTHRSWTRQIILFYFFAWHFFAVFGLYGRVSGKGRVDRNARQAAKSRLGMKLPTSQVIRVPKLPIFTLLRLLYELRTVMTSKFQTFFKLTSL
jgi:hypothetical protein